MEGQDFPGRFSAKEFARYANLNLIFSHNKNEMETDMSNIFIVTGPKTLPILPTDKYSGAIASTAFYFMSFR